MEETTNNDNTTMMMIDNKEEKEPLEAATTTTTTTTKNNTSTNSIISDDDCHQQQQVSSRSSINDSEEEEEDDDGSSSSLIGKEGQDQQDSERSRVSFGEVRIRRHERILDHRPSATYAGLELGWAHISSERLLLDDFEIAKHQEMNRFSSSSSSKSSLGSLLEGDNTNDTTDRSSCHAQHTTPGERLQVLSEYGYSMMDVIKLEKQKKKALEKRRESEIESDDDIDMKISRSGRKYTTRSKSPIRRVIKVITRSLSPTRSRQQQQQQRQNS